MPRQKKDGHYINCYLDTQVYDTLCRYANDVGQTKTLAIERILKQYIYMQYRSLSVFACKFLDLAIPIRRSNKHKGITGCRSVYKQFLLIRHSALTDAWTYRSKRFKYSYRN